MIPYVPSAARTTKIFFTLYTKNTSKQGAVRTNVKRVRTAPCLLVFFVYSVKKIFVVRAVEGTYGIIQIFKDLIYIIFFDNFVWLMIQKNLNRTKMIYVISFCFFVRLPSSSSLSSFS